MRYRHPFRTGLATGFVILLLAACASEKFDLIYRYDAFEFVESAVASRKGVVFAEAKRLQWHPAGSAAVTEILVEETWFTDGAQHIVYTGRLGFRCRTNDEFCERISDTPVTGKRPHDIFTQWPFATNSTHSF